ncbi:MAG: hypothetical protein HYS65_03975 [Betaproteobacteria bacterium]|nr:hypothetical protein [Betaproteobacteria bacterium]MBI2226910.1 hypothetical protein [Betaproteobacteria bacterium]MBI2291948.1 hypothetical protein [Betaproteobacteria bacterium]MBI3052860.1 hypothetical protein [Betaproteobacteria bacterium]
MDDAIIADDGYAQAFAEFRQRGDGRQAIAFPKIPDQRIGQLLVRKCPEERVNPTASSAANTTLVLIACLRPWRFVSGDW